MAKSFPLVHIAHGQHIGYSLKKVRNDPTYTCFYRTPDGRRAKRDTNHTAMERAKLAAAAILDEVYAPAVTDVRAATWDEAVERIKASALADGLREPSINYYLKLIRRIRTFYAATSGPADISAGMAEAWKKTFSSTPTRRKIPPSQHSVFSLVRGFSALWQSWFVDKLGVCPGNPWADVEPPKTDKIEVKVIDDDTLTHFLGWLDTRFSGWELPRLFLETKAVTGCRLADLCGLESAQLKDGRLHFRADQRKGRKAANVQLPAALAAKLEAIKGPKYLWESHPAGLKEAVKKMGCPTHRIKPDFVPKRFYHWVETLFLDYRAANPDRPAIHSHQLRKRAFTKAYEAGVSEREASIAFGCNPDTMHRHYIALNEQEITDRVTSKLADALAPKAAKPDEKK
jgi:integrase